MHLDDEQVQRLLHGELSIRAQRILREHLAECNECRERVVDAERDEADISALLRQVDHPVPAIDAGAIAARAGQRTRVEWGQWAAGVLLFLGAAGAAYAFPGSPLRDWVDSAVGWIAGVDRPSPAPTQAESPEPRVAGVAAIPGPRFIIAFESPEAGGQARITLTDRDEVTVRAPLGAAGFTSAADRLVIDNQDTGATYEIEIPRAAPRVEIHVAGKRIFLKDSSRVLAEGSAENGSHYLLPLSP
jgi:hypothetical protein